MVQSGSRYAPESTIINISTNRLVALHLKNTNFLQK
ncbi:MAG: hypothetical protein ACI9LN_003675, partial [Saprospiraceae bacterium]